MHDIFVVTYIIGFVYNDRLPDERLDNRIIVVESIKNRQIFMLEAREFCRSYRDISTATQEDIFEYLLSNDIEILKNKGKE
jgi:hypothetical protein